MSPSCRPLVTASVQDGHIRLMLCDQGFGSSAVGRLGHNLHVRFVFQEVANALAHNGVVIRQYDAYHDSVYSFLREFCPHEQDAGQQE